MGKPLKLAYLVGVGEYQWKFLTQWTKLDGPKNDVGEMAFLFQNDFGFDLLGNKPVLDSEATYDNIKIGFEELTKAVKGHNGSILVYYHSGHGYQQKEKLPGSEEDRQDEVLVTHDCKYLWDNELNQIITKLGKTAEDLQIICIIDSCHSGTILRGVEQVRIKMAPPRKETIYPSQLDGDANKLVKGPSGWLPKSGGKDKYVLMSACRDEQLAREMPLGDNGIHYSLFTYHLINGLKMICQNGQGLTYQELTRKVTDCVENDANSQSPQIEGNITWPIFGGNWPKASNYFEVTNIKEKKVSLKGGVIHGLHKGTILDIRGSFETNEGISRLRSIGKAEILDTQNSLVCTAVLQEIPSFDTSKFRHGREIVVGYTKEVETFKMNVLVDKEITVELRETIGKSHLLKPIDNVGKTIKAWLHFANNKIWICYPDGYLYTRNSFNNDNSHNSSILEHLEKIARFNNMWNLRNEISETCLTEKDVFLRVQRISKKNIFEELTSVDDQYAVARIGESIRINIVNNFRKPLYANILLFNNDASIELLYPASVGTEDNRVSPRKPKLVGDYNIVEPEGKFKFKLIASYKSIDLRSLTQAGLADIILRGESNIFEYIKSHWSGSATKSKILEEVWGTFDFPFWVIGGQGSLTELQKSLSIPCPDLEKIEQ